MIWVFAPKVPSVGSRGRKPVVGWPPHQFPLLRRALAVGAKAEIGALPCHCWVFCWRLAAIFCGLSPCAPSPSPSLSEILKAIGEGGYVGVADWEASASRRNADAAIQPQAGEFGFWVRGWGIGVA